MRKKPDLPKSHQLLNFIFFLGLVASNFLVHMERATTFPKYWIFKLILCLGLFLIILIGKKVKQKLDEGSKWTSSLICVVGFCPIIMIIPVGINYCFPLEGERLEKVKIIGVGSIPGYPRHKRNPYVTVDYKGIEKDILFPSSQIEKVELVDSVKLVVQQGRLGYDIIIQKELF